MSNHPYVLECIPRETCIHYISKNSDGRISLNIDALPEIIPTPYRYVNEKIHIPVPKQHNILRSIEGSVVAFETGGLDPESLEGFSIQVIGVAEMVGRNSKLKDMFIGNPCYLEIYPSIIKGSLIHAHKN